MHKHEITLHSSSFRESVLDVIKTHLLLKPTFIMDFSKIDYFEKSKLKTGFIL